MLAELEPEAEVVSTPVTVEGDLAGVFEREVVSQRLWDGKPLPALEAAVGLNACVDEEVPEEDGRTCGGVHAQGTKVGFFLVSIQLVHGERQQWVAQVFHVGLRGARVPQFPPEMYQQKILKVRVEMCFHPIVRFKDNTENGER